jgi:hypothetical protein
MNCRFLLLIACVLYPIPLPPSQAPFRSWRLSASGQLKRKTSRSYAEACDDPQKRRRVREPGTLHKGSYTAYNHGSQSPGLIADELLAICGHALGFDRSDGLHLAERRLCRAAGHARRCVHCRLWGARTLRRHSTVPRAVGTEQAHPRPICRLRGRDHAARFWSFHAHQQARAPRDSQPGSGDAGARPGRDGHRCAHRVSDGGGSSGRQRSAARSRDAPLKTSSRSPCRSFGWG